MNTVRNQYWNFGYFHKFFLKNTKNAPILTIFVGCGWLTKHTFVKTIFLIQGVSKRKDLMKISKVIFHIKPIPSHIMRM